MSVASLECKQEKNIRNRPRTECESGTTGVRLIILINTKKNQLIPWRLQMRDTFNLNVRPEGQLLHCNAGPTL